MTIAYLNGEFLLLENAKISVLDRGFIFADGVYEVIPVYQGRCFELDQHLQRLENSLSKIQLINPLSRQQWQAVIAELIEKNGLGHQNIYLQVTRGAAMRDHKFPNNVVPTVLLWSTPFTPPIANSSGVKTITCPDTRWLHCDIKSISLIANVLFRQQAIAAGADEAILIREGNVTEGAASNLFIVSKGVVMTHPKNQFILAGISREVILTLMKKAGIPYQEVVFSEETLRQADEIWLSSSLREVSPVTVVDGKPVGNGKPGDVWMQVWELFQIYKKEHFGV